MTDINDIKLNIKEIITINEMIVSTYDSKLLCSDYEDTLNKLKKLCNTKKDLFKSLEKNMNEFFNLKQNLLSKKFKINSFKLIPTLICFEYKFHLPKSVDKTSRQYFCHITMMDRLTREYDSISKVNDEYLLLDIASALNLDNFFKAIEKNQ